MLEIRCRHIWPRPDWRARRAAEPSAPRAFDLLRARLVDHVAQPLRDLAVAQARLISGRLHGDRHEMLIVPVEMTLEQGDDMRGLSHCSELSIALVHHVFHSRCLLRQRSEDAL
jgi:hypothetical protein